MSMKDNREQLAELAANSDVHSLTGLFLVGGGPEPRGFTAQTIKQPQFGQNLVPNPDYWGSGNWGADGLSAAEFIDNLPAGRGPQILAGLRNTATQIIETPNQVTQAAMDAFHKTVQEYVDLLHGSFSFDPETNTVKDERRSRLIKRMDLTEWIEIPNRHILYYVLTEAEGERHQAPLGQVTVWVSGGAQVRHVRSKTAKTFVRGEIAQRLKTQDFDPDLEGILRAFFDVDAEDAFSSNVGAC